MSNSSSFISNFNPGVNKTWLKLIGFPCGFLILGLALQTALLHGLRNYSTGKLGVWNQAVKGKINADILFAGSSRTWVHFDPRLVQKQTGRSAYNIGRDGALPDLQLAFLKMYLRHNQKPEVLVQGLDMMMFRSSEKIYHPWQYQPYLQEPDIYQSARFIDPAFRIYKFAPLLGIFKTRAVDLAFRGLAGRPKKEKQVYGFEPQRKSWSGDFEKFKRSHPEGIRFEVENRAVQTVRSLLEHCRKNGIKVILVYSPEYFENQELTRNREEIFEIFRQLSVEFQAPLWDYSSHSICRQKKYFYNSQHMNQEGALLFSEDLAGRLRPEMASPP